MTSTSLVPTSRPSDLATFTLTISGKAVLSEVHVLAITTIHEINRLPLARIVLMDGDAASGEFAVSDSEDFITGSEIEVLMGYHSNEISVFVGIVVSHSIRVARGNPSQLVVECRDKAVAMTVGRRSSVRSDVTDSDAIEEIVSRYGLQTEIESSSVPHNELVQFRTSDWDFVLSRAEAVGQVVRVKDGRFSTFTPKVNSDTALSLEYGGAIIDFEASVDARDQLMESKTSSWSHSDQSRVDVTASEPALEEPGNLSGAELSAVTGHASASIHAGQLAEDELQAWADGLLRRSRLAKMRGRVRCQGFAEIEPGDSLELGRVGKRFEGKVFVSAVRHQFVNQIWNTDIQVGLSPDYHNTRDRVQAPAAAGLLPTVSGLEIGIVMQLEGDPEGSDRILINLPMVNPDQAEIWARLASPYAGEDHSICFKPEIGDEVIVGFLSADPRDPVILGATHSSAKPAPYEAADDNFEKGIVTAGELRITFHDDDKTITVSTPGGNVLKLSESAEGILLEDQNGNKVDMSSSGIAITAVGDLSLEASGDIKIKAVNIDATADAEFKAEGSAGAALKSGGATKVKGSIVQIN